MTAGPLITALLALGCAAPPPPTQLFVIIDSDLRVPEALDTVELEVDRAPEAPLGPFVQLVDPAKRFAVPLPISVSLRARAELDREVEITVRGARRGVARVTRRARVRFVPDEIRVVCLHLSGACVDVGCDDGETCVEGRCTSSFVDSDALVELNDGSVASCTASLPLIDGGGSLDGGVDAAAPDAARPDDGGTLDGAWLDGSWLDGASIDGAWIDAEGGAG